MAGYRKIVCVCVCVCVCVREREREREKEREREREKEREREMEDSVVTHNVMALAHREALNAFATGPSLVPNRLCEPFMTRRYQEYQGVQKYC